MPISERIHEVPLSHGRFLNKGTIFSVKSRTGTLEFLDAYTALSGEMIINALDSRRRHYTSVYLRDVTTVHKKRTAQNKARLAEIAAKNEERRAAVRAMRTGLR